MMRRRLGFARLMGLLVGLAMTHPAAAQDLNGDGFVDAVFTAKQAYNQVCYGDGTGKFSDCRDIKGAGQFLMPDTLNTTDAALGDWDGDGALDIIFSIAGSQNRVCLNNGGDFNSGAGCPEVFIQVFDSEGLAVGDIDGDGSLDTVYANGGAGVSEVNLVCFRGTNAGCAFIGQEAVSTTGVALGDVDGDGRLDFLFSNLGADNTVCLFQGRPTSDIVNVDCRAIPAGANSLDSNAVAVGNLNGDALLDLAFANTGRKMTCVGTETGTDAWAEGGSGFTCAEHNPSTTFTLSDDGANATDVVMADILPSLAGDEIIFVASDSFNTRCILRFACGSSLQPTESVDWNGFQVLEPIVHDAQGVAVGDVNGDGHLDVVVANTEGVSHTYFGQGFASGSGVEVSTRAGLAGAPSSVALGDVGASPVVNEDPAAQVASLSATLGDLGMTSQDVRVLAGTLDQLAASIARGNLDSANGQVGAFINQVEARVRSRRLSQPAGASLVLAAENIRAALNQ